MKTILNPSSPKAYRRIGKVCFIAVLSIFIGNYFNSDFSHKYGQNQDHNASKIETFFGGEKEVPDTPVKAPSRLWKDVLFTFALLTLFFASYELSGLMLGWGFRRIGSVMFPDSHAGGKEEMYPPGGAISQKRMARVNRELKPMEKIRWIEQPIPRYFTPRAKAYFLFGIPWTAFIIFWILGASVSWWAKGGGGSGVMTVFGIPFLLIGLGLLSSPLWAYRRALKTIYVITDRRAITFGGGSSTTINSYPPEKLKDVYRKEHKDGTGDVIILRHEWQNSDDQYRVEEVGFLRVRDPQGVERILKKLAGQASAPEKK
jgi:hypothetical protein